MVKLSEKKKNLSVLEFPFNFEKCFWTLVNREGRSTKEVCNFRLIGNTASDQKMLRHFPFNVAIFSFVNRHHEDFERDPIIK